MKISWVQDLDIFHDTGGAQATDRAYVTEGFRRGHEFSLIGRNEAGNFKTLDASDLLVFSNCRFFPTAWLEQARQRRPYVIVFHDYWHCVARAYFPNLEKCLTCVYADFWKRFYEASELNVFLSPLHQEMHLGVFPSLKDVPSVNIPSPIDTGLFQADSAVERKANTAVYVGPFTGYKGADNALKYARAHPELEYHFVGFDVEDGYEHEYSKLLGEVGHVYGPMPNNYLPKVYSHYEYFLEIPPNPLPNERTCAEAFLCGCKLIINPLVGFHSWLKLWGNDRTNVRSEIRLAPRRFWEAVEAIKV